MTIIGAIGHNIPLLAKLGKYTNCDLVRKFLYMTKNYVKDPKKTVLVLDNCSSHCANRTDEIVEKLGYTLLYLPVTCSRLNPIEKLWAIFKKAWRTRLLQLDHNMEREEMENEVLGILYTI